MNKSHSLANCCKLTPSRNLAKLKLALLFDSISHIIDDLDGPELSGHMVYAVVWHRSYAVLATSHERNIMND